MRKIFKKKYSADVSRNTDDATARKVLDDLGFIVASESRGYSYSYAEEHENETSFVLAYHPAGFIAYYDTFGKGGYTAETGELVPRKEVANSLHVYFQITSGCGEEARKRAYSISGNGGACLDWDGTLKGDFSFDAVNGGISLLVGLREAEQAGRVLPFEEWQGGFIYLPHHLYEPKLCHAGSLADAEAFAEKYKDRLAASEKAWRDSLPEQVQIALAKTEERRPVLGEVNDGIWAASKMAGERGLEKLSAKDTETIKEWTKALRRGSYEGEPVRLEVGLSLIEFALLSSQRDAEQVARKIAKSVSSEKMVEMMGGDEGEPTTLQRMTERACREKAEYGISFVPKEAEQEILISCARKTGVRIGEFVDTKSFSILGFIATKTEEAMERSSGEMRSARTAIIRKLVEEGASLTTDLIAGGKPFDEERFEEMRLKGGPLSEMATFREALILEREARAVAKNERKAKRTL